MSRSTNRSLPRIVAAALLAAVAVTPGAGALLPTGAEARFHIQAIEVRGAKHVSSAIVASESLIETGQVYTESELRSAVERIRRLPFILDVGFALGKGSERNTYVLLIDVHETRQFFYELDFQRTWLGEPLALESTGLSDHAQASNATAGARLFAGRYGMLFAAAGDEGGRVGLSRYNLFGKNAVLTVGLSSETCCSTAIAPLGLDPTLSSWIGKRSATSAMVSLAAPLGIHQSLRGSFSHTESKEGLRLPALGRLETGDRFDFKDRREDEVRLAWSYDTTDDPAFPFAGTTLSVSLDFRSFAAELAAPAVAGASSSEMSSELLRLSMLGERHWPVGRRHAFAAGLSLAVGRGAVENLPASALETVDGKLSGWELAATIRHSLRMVEAKRARRFHELYWLNTFSYSVDSVSPEFASAYRQVEVAAFSSAIVYRNDWGVVRFGIRVLDVGDVI